LLAGVLGIVVVLGLSSAAIAATQSRQLNDQLDRQLDAVAEAASRAANQPLVERPERAGPASFGSVFIGAVQPDGTLITLVQPLNDPDLRPDYVAGQRYDEPTDIGTVAGDATNVRALTFVADDRLLLVAVPTTDADESLRTLIVTQIVTGALVVVALALFSWWIIRHGLRPIRKMTESADAIAAGAVDRRVEQPPGRTEAARLGRALNHMIDTTQNAEAKQRRFVADVSHELRTPLTTLQGYTALYEQGSLSEPAALDDAMRRINDEAGRMRRVVEQLLTLAHLDELQPLEMTTLDVGQILADLASDVGAIQPERIVGVDAPAGLTMEGDRDQVIQALTAITANALRYTPTDTPLAFRGLAGVRSVRLEIEDHGPGIAAADANRLFERFYRVDGSRNRTTGGNGLGLAIVASIADAHNGTHGVSETPGGGATFWMEIPGPPNSESTTTPREMLAPGEANSGSGSPAGLRCRQ
jgi:two-component system OmpR family sensor kinase